MKKEQTDKVIKKILSNMNDPEYWPEHNAKLIEEVMTKYYTKLPQSAHDRQALAKGAKNGTKIVLFSSNAEYQKIVKKLKNFYKAEQVQTSEKNTEVLLINVKQDNTKKAYQFLEKQKGVDVIQILPDEKNNGVRITWTTKNTVQSASTFKNMADVIKFIGENYKTTKKKYDYIIDDKLKNITTLLLNTNELSRIRGFSPVTKENADELYKEGEYWLRLKKDSNGEKFGVLIFRSQGNTTSMSWSD